MTEQRFKHTRLATVMSYEAFKVLDEAVQYNQKLPDNARIVTSHYFSGKGSNLLTSVIIRYLRWQGFHAERTSNTGQMRRMKDGSMKYTYGTGMNGTSDIKAVIGGKFVALEIKYNRDRQSEAQKKYQKEVEQAGGKYWIIHSLDELIEKIETIKTPV